MNLTANLFPSEFYLGAHILYGLLLLFTLWRAPWRLLRNQENLHVYLGSMVLLLLIWSLKAGFEPGLQFHILGATLFMLMFGWHFAILAISVVLAGIFLTSEGMEWPSFSINALVMVAFPVLLSYAIYRLSLRYLPHHFFVYVLFNGFFTGALTMAATIALSTLLLLGFSDYTFDYLAGKFLPFSPMMVFAEGFFTGMLASSLVLFSPDWIGSFTDQRYLNGK